MIWVYFNPENLKYNPNPNGTYEMWFTQYLTLTGPNGELIASQEVINNHNRSIHEEEREHIFGEDYITLTGEIATGKYTVKLDVTDKLADKTVSASTSFWVSL